MTRARGERRKQQLLVLRARNRAKGEMRRCSAGQVRAVIRIRVRRPNDTKRNCSITLRERKRKASEVVTVGDSSLEPY